MKQAGDIVKGYAESASYQRGPSAIVGADGLADVAQLFLEATATSGGATLTIDYLNSPYVRGNGIGLFTPEWGDVEVQRTLEGATNTWQVLVRDGIVISSTASVDAAQLESNEQVLVAVGSAVDQMSGLTVGDQVVIDVAMRGADDVAAAINGFFPVALDGEVVTTNTTDLHPRTVIAIGEEGTRMALMIVDGRQVGSRGMTEVETAEFFLGLGYTDVLNLDGGGSPQMNARLAGDEQMIIRSNPSDGGERQTANSVGVFVEEGSDRVVGYKVQAANTSHSADQDVSDDFVVMTGLTRHLSAKGYNEVFAPVDTKPRWSDPNGNVSIDSARSGARRSLREAVAQDPEFIAILGDWVDRGFPEDIALAKRILEEEIPADIPYYYVAGNHEMAGPGNLNAWIDEFGDPWYTLDHRGTRIIVRATPGYNYRSGGFEQLLDLKLQLDEAAADPAIDNVIVLQHHPLTEISATGGSTINDSGEATLVKKWFSEFRMDSGKGIALYAGGTGTFEGAMFDGVHQITNGNAGKGPNGSPDWGGFTGWSLVAVNPDPAGDPLDATRWAQGDDWIRVAFMPHVDTLEVVAPRDAHHRRGREGRSHRDPGRSPRAGGLPGECGLRHERWFLVRPRDGRVHGLHRWRAHPDGDRQRQVRDRDDRRHGRRRRTACRRQDRPGARARAAPV